MTSTVSRLSPATVAGLEVLAGIGSDGQDPAASVNRRQPYYPRFPALSRVIGRSLQVSIVGRYAPDPVAYRDLRLSIQEPAAFVSESAAALAGL
jgi:hypothetical protein